MKIIWILRWICVRIALSQATSHWMVTETGLLQPKDNSPFLLENSFNLLYFLNQDTRWENIFNIYYNLIHKQKNINRLWINFEYDANFDKHIAGNEFCVKVGNVELIDWYSTYLEDGRYKNIPEKEYALQKTEYGETDVPDCKKISSLTFSMFAFEHLDSMINREHLNATAEYSLPEKFAPIMTVDQFGHWLSEALRKNSSSWLHYNLAAIYWRTKGNMLKAMECSRRAVHNAPRHFKSSALLCMGSILHRSKQSEDAIIVLGASIDHDQEFPIGHFILGGALAVTGDFNTSLTHYELSIKFRPKFALAEKLRNGVLCHLDMFKKIQIAQSTVNDLSIALKDYLQMEVDWLKIQAAFLNTMKHEEVYEFKSLESNCIKMEEVTGLDIRKLKRDGDKNAVVQYFIDSPTYNEEWVKQIGVVSLDTAQSLQRLVRTMGPQAGLPTTTALAIDETRNVTEILKEIGPMPAFADMFSDSSQFKALIKAEIKAETPKKIDKTPSNIEVGTSKPVKKKSVEKGNILYPSNLKVNRNKEIFDTDPDWPDITVCRDAITAFAGNFEAMYPVFLPFENKGIKLENLLTERIGVPALMEHELPWHPPVCPSDKDLSIYTQRKGRKIHMVPEESRKDMLRTQLLRYLSDSHLDILRNKQEAEIGQRIQTAIEKKLASKWVLYTIASLYWRVRGNTPYALNCLLTASRNTEIRHRDVVLVSLASVFIEMGLVDEGATLAEEAYKLSPYEPATNFLIAQINIINKNHKTHMFHLKQVIRVDPQFMGGIARKILNCWGCTLKDINNLREYAGIDENEVCAEVEPGVSMVCDRAGINCDIRNRHCYEGKQRETSQIVRMLELKDETIQGVPVDEISSLIFDRFIEAMPTDRTNKVAHQKNYDAMMKIVQKMLKGCSNGVCTRIEPENTMMKIEDCTFQHLQLDYWLQIISFQQHINGADRR